MATLLVEVTRGPVVECRHYGAIAVADAAGRLVASAGDVALLTHLRSAAKPFQALPVIANGAAERFALTTPELAILTASHNGELDHRTTVAGILQKIVLTPDALLCGYAPPADPLEAARITLGLAEPSPLYHGCSGNHVGMLASCVHRGEPVESYLSPDHPVQQEILHAVSACLGVPANEIPLGVDGCGVPSFVASLASIARGCAALAASASGPYQEAARRLLDAMAAVPFLVAGTGRFNTSLMAVAGDRVVAKTGAEGVLCLMLRERGWGIAIKIEDGNGRGLPVIVSALLTQLGVFDEALAARFLALHPPQVRNGAGDVVGELRPVFTVA